MQRPKREPTWGEKLKAARGEKSQKEFADAIGCTVAMISLIEQREKPPRASTTFAELYAKVLGVPL